MVKLLKDHWSLAIGVSGVGYRGSGQWSMVIGVSGIRCRVSGQWSMVSGQWSVVNDHWSLGIGCRVQACLVSGERCQVSGAPGSMLHAPFPMLHAPCFFERGSRRMNFVQRGFLRIHKSANPLISQPSLLRAHRR
jgi:hypothetical protein